MNRSSHEEMAIQTMGCTLQMNGCVIGGVNLFTKYAGGVLLALWSMDVYTSLDRAILSINLGLDANFNREGWHLVVES